MHICKVKKSIQKFLDQFDQIVINETSKREVYIDI